MTRAPKKALMCSCLGVVLTVVLIYLVVGIALAVYCFSKKKGKDPPGAEKAAASNQQPATSNQQPAQPKPDHSATTSGPVDKDVSLAVTQSILYFKCTQNDNGTWPGYFNNRGSHEVAFAAFPGLTLLECGVPANDPAIQKAAKFVRDNCSDLQTTYAIALAILFLDRLGENNRDDRLIGELALRLVAGQPCREKQSLFSRRRLELQLSDTPAASTKAHPGTVKHCHQ